LVRPKKKILLFMGARYGVFVLLTKIDHINRVFQYVSYLSIYGITQACTNR
jgi:hypothetical protein